MHREHGSMWSNLGIFQKLFIGLAILAVLPFAPELFLLADLGGIELVFSFLLLYFKPFIIRLQAIVQKVKVTFENFIYALSKSAVAQPKVFATQGLFCTFALAFTGSLVFASAFFLPALLLQPVLV